MLLKQDIFYFQNTFKTNLFKRRIQMKTQDQELKFFHFMKKRFVQNDLKSSHGVGRRRTKLQNNNNNFKSI